MLSGSVPEELIPLLSLPKLTMLRLDSNQLSGTVPAWFGNYAGPKLGLANNMFSGNLPVSHFSTPFNADYQRCGTFDDDSYCTYHNATGKYSTIPPNVTNVPGAFLTACPSGTYRSGADTTVHGTLYFPAPICSPCAPGTVALLPNTPLYTSCPAGNVPAANASACIPCEPGTFLNATGGTAALRCDACPGGQHAPSRGATSCLNNPEGAYSTADRISYVACSPGTYLNKTLQSCPACAAGTISAASAIACTSCPAGNIAAANFSTCTPCTVGTFLNATTLLCESCALGYSAPSTGMSACIPNAVGFKTVVLHTVASTLTIGGVATSDFGMTENATLLSSLASILSVPASAVSITSVFDSTRRRLSERGG